MKFSEAIKRKGVYIGIMMIVLGIFMMISSRIERNSLVEEHPFLQYTEAQIEKKRVDLMMMDDGIDTPKKSAIRKMLKDNDSLNSDDRLTLRIRYGRTGMSFWAGLLILLAGVGSAVIFFLKERQIQSIIREDEQDESGHGER